MSHTIRERAHNNKMAGGYKVKGVGNCTIGFVAIRDGNPGIVTAGHCTENEPYEGETGDQRFDQPVDYNLIGYEDLDKEFSTSYPGCDNDEGCKRTDAAFIEFTSVIQYNRGWIAKPNLGGLTVDPDTDHYSITSETAIGAQGDNVTKVGQRTGRTAGNISNTCVDNDDSDNDEWIGEYLCMIKVSTGTMKGDSGAPVFKIPNSSSDNVQLLGILTHGTSSYYLYSPLAHIYLELSASSTWDVCTSGC